MRLARLVSISSVMCALVLSGTSCTTVKYGYEGRFYSSQTEALAAQEKDLNALLAQIPRAEKPVGGTLVSITVTDDLIPKFYITTRNQRSALRPEERDYLIQTIKRNWLFMAGALKKRALFDRVEWRRSADPEGESFPEDYAVLLPAKHNPDGWLFKTRKLGNQIAVPIQAGAPSLSSLQRVTFWLDAIEEAAKKDR